MEVGTSPSCCFCLPSTVTKSKLPHGIDQIHDVLNHGWYPIIAGIVAAHRIIESYRRIEQQQGLVMVNGDVAQGVRQNVDNR